MTTEPPLVRVVRAMDFAALKHEDQRRKGARREPYINHLAEVARLLAEATGGGDPDLVIAGLLHDAIEDTDATADEIANRFGADVAAVVAEVTDDKSLPKDMRKRLQIENAPRRSARAKRLIIADKISNLDSLALSPPADWSDDRRRAYVDWAEAVVDGCRGVDPVLDTAFDAVVARARAALIRRSA